MTDRALALFLRVYACLLLAALPAVLVPRHYLASAYVWLGLGDSWPSPALLEYLARTASGLYAFLGGMVLLMSFDPARYRPLLRLLGWFSLPAAVYLSALGLSLDLPGWWVAVEGPMVLCSGVLLLWLTRVR